MNFWEESDLNEVNEEALEEQSQELIASLMNPWNCWEAKEEPLDRTNGHVNVIRGIYPTYDTKNLCTGCGNPTMDFDSTESEREYAVSGLCQKCQDEIFK